MFQAITTRILALAWGLWLGGIVTIYICADALFARFADNRDIAGAAASSLFLLFARYQLILAAVALIASALVAVALAGGRTTALFILLAAATIAAVVSGAWVTPQLEAMRIAGTTKLARFGQLHGLSMLLFTAEAALLLAAGLLFGWASPSDSTGESRVSSCRSS